MVSMWRVIGCAVLLVLVTGCTTSGGEPKGDQKPKGTTTTTAPEADAGLIAFEQGVFDVDEHLAFFDPATATVTPVPGGALGYYARFSQDGSMLVWARMKDASAGVDGVMVHDLRTGKTRQVAKDGGCPSFAPEGRSVVVSADRAERIDLSSGAVEPLLGPSAGCRIELEDGRFIYTHHDEKIERLDGAKETTIYRAPGCELDTASLSPDGTKLAFVRECKAKGDYGVTVIDVDGSNPRSVAGGNAYGTGWSPDGTSIVTAHADEGEKHASLWILDAVGSAAPEKVRPGPVNTATWGPTATTG